VPFVRVQVTPSLENQTGSALLPVEVSAIATNPVSLAATPRRST
jgi:hypothetical protein